MVIECSNCHARYNVDASKIPSSGVKVKCHKCQHIIIIRKEPPKTESVPAAPVQPPVPDVQPSVTPPTTPPAPPEAPSMPEPEVPESPPTPTMPSQEPEAPESQPAPQEPSFPETPSERPAPVTTPSATVTPPVPEPPEPESPVDVSAGPAEPAVTAPTPAIPAKEQPAPTTMSEEDKKWNERARRLAKALASDLVLYNQDKVEEGLRNGTLANLLGSEIRRSWEYYCQQIPKHIVESTDHFKDQLNKIVGKGKEIFK